MTINTVCLSKTQIAYDAMIITTLLIIACGPRIIEARANFLRSAPQICPIVDGNLIGIRMFIRDSNECFEACERKEDCKYFR